MARRRKQRRFVFDTNVLISSALTPGGEARKAFALADHAGYFLFSDETFAELKQVLYRPAFDPYLTNSDRRRFMLALLGKSARIFVREGIRAGGDPDDDMFLEVAVSGKAACVVTRNVTDFPSEQFRGIPILTPAQFLEREKN